MIPDPIPVTGIGVSHNGTPLLDNAVINCAAGDDITLVPSVEPANADVTDADFVWSTDTLVPVVTGRTAVYTPDTAGSYVVSLTVGELSMSFTITAVAPAIQSVDVFA